MRAVHQDRSTEEINRVSRLADALCALMHEHWSEESAGGGEVCPADYCEAALMAAAGLAAQHIDPMSDLDAAIRDHVELFRDCFTVEMFANIRARASS